MFTHVTYTNRRSLITRFQSTVKRYYIGPPQSSGYGLWQVITRPSLLLVRIQRRTRQNSHGALLNPRETK